MKKKRTCIKIDKNKLELLVVTIEVFTVISFGITRNIFYLIWSILIIILVIRNKLYLKAHLIFMIYFFIIGYIIGELLNVASDPYLLFSPNGFNLLYNYYFYLMILVAIFLPIYKFVIEKKIIEGVVEDLGSKYLIVNIKPDIFSGMKPGLYVVKKEVIFNVGDHIKLKKTKEGLVPLKNK